ncbi:WD-40 repeat protein [Pirellula staleyi DSM 6068]|uniref:WD-40 repeat protein n=1 Tax=Pirellula staleyi (strain ATCC 27377 / DSM 6068 / ICPB 4128) TaxID=530564 RepID=D2QX29_PIRSD|nr:WD40 repeat domain-containing protein [Pirellula staleyi]ADB17869.1 WD-40 repeat protein [Pirellula staleyi DSM 6068]
MPRFSLLQLLLLGSLVAIAFGVFTSSQRLRHADALQSIQLSPDGQVLLVGYQDRSIEAWSLTGARPQLIGSTSTKASFPGYFGNQSLALLSDTEALLIDLAPNNVSPLSSLGPVEIVAWNFRTGNRRVVLRSSDSIHTLSFARDAGILATIATNHSEVKLYNLEDQTLIDKWSEPSMIESLHISQSGRYVTVMNFVGEQSTYDISDLSKRQKQSLSQSGFCPPAITDNGQIFHSVRQREDQLFRTLLQQPASSPGTFTTQELPAAEELICLAANSDGTKLAVKTSDALELWQFDSETAAQPSRRIPLKVSKRRFDPLALTYFFQDQLAISADGNVVASLDFPTGLTIWKDAEFQQPLQIGSRQRLLLIAIYWGAIVAWSVAWGIVQRTTPAAKKSSEQLPGAGVSPYRVFYVGLLVKILQHYRWICVAWIGGAIVLYFMNPSTAERHWYLIGGLAPAYLYLFVQAVRWVNRRIYGPHWDFEKLLQQSTKTKGVSTPLLPSVTLWETQPTDRRNTLPPLLTALTQRVSMLLGRPITIQKPWLLGVIPRQQQYSTIFARNLTYQVLVSKPPNHSFTFVCDELTQRHLSETTPHLVSGFSALLVSQEGLDRSAPWLTVGISSVFQKPLIEGMLDHAARRMQRLLELRGEDVYLVASQMSIDELTRSVLAYDQRDNFWNVQIFSSFVITFTQAMLANDPTAARWQHLLKLAELKSPHDSLQDLATALGTTTEALLHEWRAWLERTAPPNPTFAAPASHQHLLARIYPQIRDRRTPADVKIDIVRHLGIQPYWEVGGVLVELLEDRRLSFREEVLEALAFVSGEKLGDDTAAWKAWWETTCKAHVISAALIVDTVAKDADATPVESVPDELPAASHHRDESCSTSAPQVTASSPPRDAATETKLKFPLGLVQVWILQMVGGILSVGMFVTMTMSLGTFIYPMFYGSLIIGMWGIVNAASRSVLQCRRIAYFQMLLLLSCDPINFFLGLISLGILNLRVVDEYLREVQQRETEQAEPTTENALVARSSS